MLFEDRNDAYEQAKETLAYLEKQKVPWVVDAYTSEIEDQLTKIIEEYAPEQ
jgi:hypothetical protein